MQKLRTIMINNFVWLIQAALQELLLMYTGLNMKKHYKKMVTMIFEMGAN